MTGVGQTLPHVKQWSSSAKIELEVELDLDSKCNSVEVQRWISVREREYNEQRKLTVKLTGQLLSLLDCEPGKEGLLPFGGASDIGLCHEMAYGIGGSQFSN